MTFQPLSKLISNKEFTPNLNLFEDVYENDETITKEESEVLKVLNTSAINLRSFCDILYDTFKSGLKPQGYFIERYGEHI